MNELVERFEAMDDLDVVGYHEDDGFTVRVEGVGYELMFFIFEGASSWSYSKAIGDDISYGNVSTVDEAIALLR